MEEGMEGCRCEGEGGKYSDEIASAMNDIEEGSVWGHWKRLNWGKTYVVDKAGVVVVVDTGDGNPIGESNAPTACNLNLDASHIQLYASVLIALVGHLGFMKGN